MSCGTIDPAGECGCPSPSNSCEGSDCDTLHCERDPVSVGGSATWCRGSSCGEYNDCSTASLSCDCDSGLNECSGSCPTCWDSGWTYGVCGGSSGGVICGSTQKIKTRTVMPSGCEGRAAAECSGCDSSCDTTCGCDTGSYCGPCGKDPCFSVGQCVSECSSCTNVWTCNAASDSSCLTETCADLGCGQTDDCGTYCGDCIPSCSPPACGVGLTCIGSACGDTCPIDKPTQCLSGEQIVCCNNP